MQVSEKDIGANTEVELHARELTSKREQASVELAVLLKEYKKGV